MLLEAISYFSQKYPNYKFITEGSVKKLCEKYNLFLGISSQYTGVIPEKNLSYIENFRVEQKDQCYLFIIDEINHAPEIIPSSLEDIPKWVNKYKHYKYGSYGSTEYHKAPLEIVAPLKDFSLEAHKTKGHKIIKVSVPDPVVLYPVVFKETKYYLIVTAWGLEAEDDLVLNPKHN